MLKTGCVRNNNWKKEKSYDLMCCPMKSIYLSTQFVIYWHFLSSLCISNHIRQPSALPDLYQILDKMLIFEELEMKRSYMRHHYEKASLSSWGIHRWFWFDWFSLLKYNNVTCNCFTVSFSADLTVWVLSVNSMKCLNPDICM